MAKTDVEAAFRLLPVHPSCFHLLGCMWDGGLYVDKCLPMGCSISCRYFRSLLSTIQQVMSRFGVPLSPEKTEGPCPLIQFLGIEIDATQMLCRLTVDKVLDMRSLVSQSLAARKVTLRQLQSLLGKLNFACRIIPMGRIFCRRLSLATAGIRSPHHFIRLTREHKDDLKVWGAFLAEFNGKSLWLERSVSNADIHLWTDASGSVGFGTYFQGAWCVDCWPLAWASAGLVRNLTFLELFPIVVAVEIWGPRLRNRKVCFQCDNMSVVQAINNVSASSLPVIRLLRHLVLRCLQLNMWVRASHILGVFNTIADALSRQQMERFWVLATDAEGEGHPCPAWIWSLVDDTS
ncbi:uncharacterized protein RCH25_025667 [Pelodytes ibericus]